MNSPVRIRRFGLATLLLAAVAGLFFLTQMGSEENSRLATRASEPEITSSPTAQAELEEPAVESSSRAESPADQLKETVEESLAHEGERWIRGRLTLEDGSPLRGIELTAIPYEDYKLARESGRALAVQRLNGIASCGSDADGQFSMRVDAVHSQVDSFVLRNVQNGHLGQNWSAYEFSHSESLHHTLPGSAVPVHVIGEDGRSAASVPVTVFASTDSEPSVEYLLETDMTNQNGRTTLYFNSARPITIVANSRDGTATAETNKVSVQLGRLASEIELRLSSLQNIGSLKVQVMNRSGLLLDDFAVRIDPTNEHLPSRFVHSDSVGPERIIDNLPLGIVHVSLSRRYTNSPSLYSANEVTPRIVELDGAKTPTVVFKVPVLARLAFDLQREATDYAPLKIQIRDTNAGPNAEWIQHRELWQYREESSTSSSYMDQNTTYYSGPLSPGLLEIEVTELESEALRWSGQVQLIEGRITPLELHLKR